jgi:hypothetical protein
MKIIFSVRYNYFFWRGGGLEMAKEIENKKILEFYSFAFFVIGTSQQC